MSGSEPQAGGLDPAPDSPDAATPGAPAEPEPNLRRQRILAAAVLAGTLVAVVALSVVLSRNPEWVLRFGNWGYAGAFLISLVASASLILPLPGLAVAMMLGTALNPLLLGVVTGLGSALGELTGYALGSSGRYLLSGNQQQQFDRLASWTRRYGAFAIFTVAVLPLPIFDVAGIVAGAIRMPIASFLVATALGKTIKYTAAILLYAGAFGGIMRWMQAPPPLP